MSNISEMWRDSSKVTTEDQQEVLYGVYALSIGAKINDLR